MDLFQGLIIGSLYDITNLLQGVNGVDPKKRASCKEARFLVIYGPVNQAYALLYRRVVERSVIDARAIFLGVDRRVDDDFAGAAARDIGGGEVDVVRTAVGFAISFGAQFKLVRSEDERIRGGVAIVLAVHRLILPDGIDGDGERIALGVGHANNGDGHELVVHRPEYFGNGFGGRAYRRAIQGQAGDNRIMVRSTVGIGSKIGSELDSLSKEASPGS